MKNFIATTVIALVAAINAPASAHHDGHHGHHGHAGQHHVQCHCAASRPQVVRWSPVYTYHIGNAGVCYNQWRQNNPNYRIITYNGYTVQYQIPTYGPRPSCVCHRPPVVHCPPPVIVHPPVCYPQQTVIIRGGSCGNRVVYRRRSSCTTFSFGFSW